jgi:hypothetical protein
MLDPEVAKLVAVVGALNELGVPNADEEKGREFIRLLRERGYEVVSSYATRGL